MRSLQGRYGVRMSPKRTKGKLDSVKWVMVASEQRARSVLDTVGGAIVRAEQEIEDGLRQMIEQDAYRYRLRALLAESGYKIGGRYGEPEGIVVGEDGRPLVVVRDFWYAHDRMAKLGSDGKRKGHIEGDEIENSGVEWIGGSDGTPEGFARSLAKWQEALKGDSTKS